MLERFTRDARAVVIAARAEAIRRDDGWIGTEHLLVGLLEAGGPGVDVLARNGLAVDDVRNRIASHIAVDDLDADALATLGIDLDAVQRAAEEQFGAGALAPSRRGRNRPRMTRRAKKVLEYAVREAHRGRESSITSTHLLLGILREGKGLAVQVMTESGVDLDALRTQIDRDTRGRAA